MRGFVWSPGSGRWACLSCAQVRLWRALCSAGPWSGPCGEWNADRTPGSGSYCQLLGRWRVDEGTGPRGPSAGPVLWDAGTGVAVPEVTAWTLITAPTINMVFLLQRRVLRLLRSWEAQLQGLPGPQLQARRVTGPRWERGAEGTPGRARASNWHRCMLTRNLGWPQPHTGSQVQPGGRSPTWGFKVDAP